MDSLAWTVLAPRLLSSISPSLSPLPTSPGSSFQSFIRRVGETGTGVTHGWVAGLSPGAMAPELLAGGCCRYFWGGEGRDHRKWWDLWWVRQVPKSNTRRHSQDHEAVTGSTDCHVTAQEARSGIRPGKGGVLGGGGQKHPIVPELRELSAPALSTTTSESSYTQPLHCR